jgi:hypothetical protein
LYILAIKLSSNFFTRFKYFPIMRKLYWIVNVLSIAPARLWLIDRLVFNANFSSMQFVLLSVCFWPLSNKWILDYYCCWNMFSIASWL